MLLFIDKTVHAIMKHRTLVVILIIIQPFEGGYARINISSVN